MNRIKTLLAVSCLLLLCSIVFAHGSGHHQTCTYLVGGAMVKSDYNDNDVALRACETDNDNYRAIQRAKCMAVEACKVSMLKEER